MAFFQIFIPNYNSAKWIEKGLGSIFSQTFEHFVVHIADDQSTDGSPRIIQDYIRKYPGKITIDILPEKSGYPGGTRNYLIDNFKNSDTEYTLYMDSDDWMYSENCLNDIYEAAIKNNIPDIIRLPFRVFVSEKEDFYIELNENTLKDITASSFVAPWTKAVRTSKLVKFPERTLLEDIPQHLKQCDICETCCRVDSTIMVWNRQDGNKVSITKNLDVKENKRKMDISRFQMMANLYELDLSHDYSIKSRDAWLETGKFWLKEEKLV